MRYPDAAEFDKNGNPTRFFECKKGKSRYTPMQQKKDKWIRRTRGIPTEVIRG